MAQNRQTSHSSERLSMLDGARQSMQEIEHSPSHPSPAVLPEMLCAKMILMLSQA